MGSLSILWAFFHFGLGPLSSPSTGIMGGDRESGVLSPAAKKIGHFLTVTKDGILQFWSESFMLTSSFRVSGPTSVVKEFLPSSPVGFSSGLLG